MISPIPELLTAFIGGLAYQCVRCGRTFYMEHFSMDANMRPYFQVASLRMNTPLSYEARYSRAYMNSETGFVFELNPRDTLFVSDKAARAMKKSGDKNADELREEMDLIDGMTLMTPTLPAQTEKAPPRGIIPTNGGIAALNAHSDQVKAQREAAQLASGSSPTMQNWLGSEAHKLWMSTMLPTGVKPTEAKKIAEAVSTSPELANSKYKDMADAYLRHTLSQIDPDMIDQPVFREKYE